MRELPEMTSEKKVSYSQNLEKASNTFGKKDLIGIQYNPLYVGDWTYVANLFSIRYGYKIAKPLTIEKT